MNSSSFTCMQAKLLLSYLTLCDLMDCSPPGSSVLGILQARILEWGAMPSSRGSSQPRDQTSISSVSCICRWFFTTSATWETPSHVTDPENVLRRPWAWPLAVVLPPPSCPCDCRVCIFLCHVSFQNHPSSQSWGSCSHPKAEA